MSKSRRLLRPLQPRRHEPLGMKLKAHIERRMTRFLREPPSVRIAARVIVVATAIVVVVGGVMMWLFDHSEYSNVWVGMWWAIQTVTTIGYGDVTPTHVSGRIVAVLVMLWGVAFLTIIIAAITSTFVTRAARERRAPGEGGADGGTDALAPALDGRFEGLEQRLERL